MTKKMKTSVIGLLAMAMVLILVPQLSQKASAETAEPAGYIYITWEKATIGQGYLMEPTKVAYNQGETLEDLMKRLSGTDGFPTIYYSNYLTGVEDSNGSLTATFPEYITKYAEENGVTLEAKRSGSTLGSNDYSFYAGWMMNVNNESPQVGAGDVALTDGMVVRFAFTVVGYGLDCWNTGWGDLIAPEETDRSEMIKAMAEYKANSQYQYLSTVRSVATAYDNLASLGNDYGATQDTIDQNTKALNTAIDQAMAKKKADEKKAKTVEKTKITSLKKAGKKAFKVKWKTVSGAKGYQVTYSKYKNFKSKKTITVKSSTKAKTVKKLKSKKTYYVKVRAYKTYQGKTYYGSWSSAKKIKTK